MAQARLQYQNRKQSQTQNMCITVDDFCNFQKYLFHRYTANIQGNPTFCIFFFFLIYRGSLQNYYLMRYRKHMDFSQKASQKNSFRYSNDLSIMLTGETGTPSYL